PEYAQPPSEKAMTSPVRAGHKALRDRCAGPTPLALVALAALAGAACQGNSTISGNTGAGGSDPGGVGGAQSAGGSGPGGSPGSGGMGPGGAQGTGGKAAGAGGMTSDGGITVPSSCGSTTHNPNPFGCNLAWGTNSSGGALSSYSYLQFVSFWIGSEARADGTLSGCSGCTWLSNQVSKVSNIVPVFYAYIIGF